MFQVPQEHEENWNRLDNTNSISRPPQTSETVRDDLQKAVLDFEETFQRSSRQNEKHCLRENINCKTTIIFNLINNILV